MEACLLSRAAAWRPMQESHHRRAGWDSGGSSQVARHVRGAPAAAPQAALKLAPMSWLAVPAQLVAAPARTAPAAAPHTTLPAPAVRAGAQLPGDPGGTGTKRSAEVIDLLSSDDEDAVRIAAVRIATKRHQPPLRPAAPTAQPAASIDLTAAPPAAPPPRPLPPPQPSLAERLAAANERTGLELVRPPAHWTVSDTLLQGKHEFVDLPLPAGTAGVSRQVPAAPEVDEMALSELVNLNGIPHVEAVRALEHARGDVGAALIWHLSQTSRAAEVDQLAVAELLVNGLTRGDAEAALRQTGNDVQLALLYCLDCMDKRGAAAVAARQKGQASGQASGQEGGGACREEEAQQCRLLLKEGASVLVRLEAHQGISRSRVVKIERVQVSCFGAMPAPVGWGNRCSCRGEKACPYFRLGPTAFPFRFPFRIWCSGQTISGCGPRSPTRPAATPTSSCCGMVQMPTHWQPSPQRDLMHGENPHKVGWAGVSLIWGVAGVPLPVPPAC